MSHDDVLFERVFRLSIQFNSLSQYFTSFSAVNAMPTVPIPIANGTSPKRKRNRSGKGGAAPILPGSSIPPPVGVTASAALKGIEALQSISEVIPRLVPMVTPVTGAPSIAANASGAAQMDISEQAPSSSEDLMSQDVEDSTAVDEELKQAELLLEQTKQALELRTLAIKTAEEVRSKKEKTKATLHEVAIAKAKMMQIEATAVDALVAAQSKARQERESSQG